MLRGTTFGQCSFEAPQARVEPESDVHFALLLMLAAAPQEGSRREALLSALWPHADEPGARHCLRQALYRLRRLDIAVRARAGSVAIARDALSCDLTHLLYGMPSREEFVRLGALPFLPAYAPRLGAAFAEWVESLRGMVAGRLRRALTDELAVARGEARFREVGDIARSILTLDPLNEAGTIGLAESLAFEGSKVEAIRLLEDYEAEVGHVDDALRVAPRLLRQRVSECLDDALLPRRFEIPFVGREREFATLRALFREAREVEARGAVVTGEAGIGKTRLTTELMRVAALDGATVGSYSASAGDSFTPISTLVSVGQLLLSLPGALGCAHEHLTYVRRLGTPETVSVLGVSGLAADVAYAQLVHALAELVRALTDEAPVILFIDDAQRLHQTSWRVLFDIVGRVSSERFLLILATRRLPPWFGVVSGSCGHLTHHLRLAPFAPEESLVFMRLWSDKNRVPLSEDEASTCASASQGNPFYLGELAGHVGRGGDLRLAPKSIRELIELQFEAIGKGAQRLLLVIALFQGRATIRRVTQILELSADEFMAFLDEIEGAGLITTSGPAMRCKHELVAESALALSMRGVQTFARVRIAELLEREADETNSVELLGDCVTHWECAGETRRAYEAAMKLGGRLVALGMGTEAEKAYDRAGNSATNPTELVAALDGRLVACHLSANWRKVGQTAQLVAEQATRLSTYLGPTSEQLLLIAEADLYSIYGSASPSALAALAEDANTSPPIRLRAASLLAIYGENHFDSTTMQRASAAVADVVGELDGSLEATLLRTIYHTTLGCTTAAEQYARQLWAVASDGTNYATKIQNCRRAGIALCRLGQFSNAKTAINESLRLAEDLKLPLQAVACYESLSLLALAEGDISGAESHVNAMKSSRTADSDFVDLILLAVEARIAWLRRDRSHAAALLELAQQLAEPTVPRAIQTLQAIREGMRITAMSEYVPPASALPLEELHHLGRRFGDQDFSCSVLAQSLVRRGEAKRAQNMVSAYLSEHRRERYQPTAYLGEFALSDVPARGAWPLGN